MKLVCLSNLMASNTKALFTLYNTLNEMKAIIYLIGLAEIVIPGVQPSNYLESAITTSIQNISLECLLASNIATRK
jgi:hypothetical protein